VIQVVLLPEAGFEICSDILTQRCVCRLL